jgi:hypothetical protein
MYNILFQIKTKASAFLVCHAIISSLHSQPIHLQEKLGTTQSYIPINMVYFSLVTDAAILVQHFELYTSFPTE